jgi:hypothetical protein
MCKVLTVLAFVSRNYIQMAIWLASLIAYSTYLSWVDLWILHGFNFQTMNYVVSGCGNLHTEFICISNLPFIFFNLLILCLFLCCSIQQKMHHLVAFYPWSHQKQSLKPRSGSILSCERCHCGNTVFLPASVHRVSLGFVAQQLLWCDNLAPYFL